MKAKKLLPIALLAAMTLVACGGGGSGGSEASSQTSETSETSQSSGQQSQSESSGQASQSESESSPESSSQAVQYGASVKNKDAFEGIRVGDHVDLDIELTPEANVAMEIAQGNLIIEANKAGIVAITGAGVAAVGEGEVTISLYYMDFETAADQLTFTVDPKLTPKVKYGTVHEGTAEDPFDNADAVKVGHFIKDAGEKATAETDLYIKGEVGSFYHAPGSRDDGAVSWYLVPADGQTEKFEIYKAYKEVEGKQTPITEDDIWKGAVATAHGPITYYNDQMETSYAWLDKVEGDKPLPPVEYNATVAEALAVGTALTDGDQTYDWYNVTGYVVKKSGNNYFLHDTTTAPENDKEALELYNISDADSQAKLLEGAKVTVKIKLKNYHGQIENGNSNPEITVVEPGTPWSVPEPSVAKKTLAEFIAIDPKENGKKAYEVTAEVKSLDGNDHDGSKYGNITLTDGTNDLIIYGCSATATALAWDGSGAYGFKNPQDFLSNEVTAAIKVGDTLRMKLIRADYNGTIQGKGIVLEVNPDEGGGGGQTVDYGTLENPLTVAKLLADDGTICEQTQGAFSAQKVIVKGVLKEATYGASYGTYSGVLQDLEDATKTIKFTGVKLDAAVAEQVAQNDVVILEHYLEYYNSAYSLYYKKDGTNYDYGDILALVTVGTSTVTLEADEHVTVTGLEATYTNYTTAEFTIEVDNGYELDSVKVNGKDLNAVEGKYSFTVTGNAKVTVTSKEAGSVTTSITLDVNSLNLPTSYADGEATIDGVAFTTTQVANYGDGMQFRYKNSVASGFFNTTALPYAIESIEITFNAKQSADKELMYVAFGNDVVDATEGTGFSWAEGAQTVTLTPDGSFTFFKLAHNTTSGAVYLDSVVINYAIPE